MQNARGIQAGDVVRLRSGGPWMTVTVAWADGLVWCRWIDTDGAAQSAAFDRGELRRRGFLSRMIARLF